MSAVAGQHPSAEATGPEYMMASADDDRWVSFAEGFFADDAFELVERIEEVLRVVACSGRVCGCVHGG